MSNSTNAVEPATKKIKGTVKVRFYENGDRSSPVTAKIQVTGYDDAERISKARKAYAKRGHIVFEAQVVND